jgi:hypothetical protein
MIQFVDENGLVLPTPPSLEPGIKISEASRMSWPGTHGVRQTRNGSIRNLVDLTKIAASSSNKTSQKLNGA